MRPKRKTVRTQRSSASAVVFTAPRSQRAAKRRGKPSRFAGIDLAGEGHPVDAEVDAEVARRVQHTAQRRQVVRLQERVMSQLGDDSKPFLDLEDIQNSVAAELHDAYFDVGYEYGLANGARSRSRAEDTTIVSGEERARPLLGHPRAAALALIQCLWMVVSGGNGPRLLARFGPRGSPERSTRARPGRKEQ